MLEENEKLYLAKERFFDKQKLLSDLVKEYDNKIVMFMRYRNQILPFKFELTRAYFKKRNEKNDKKIQRFLFDLIFPTPTTTYRYFVEQNRAYWSQRWPLVISQNIAALLGNVDIFIFPEMYKNKNRTFTKSLRKQEKSTLHLAFCELLEYN